MQVASHSRRCSSCNMQRASRAMLHKIRKIVTHKYAHIPSLPSSSSPSAVSPRSRCKLHAACHTPRYACRTPRRGATEAVSQPVAHGHKCCGWRAGEEATYTGSTLASERGSHPQLSYKSNDGDGSGSGSPLPISGSHFSRAPQRVETGAEIN